jgi:hypothetical protein
MTCRRSEACLQASEGSTLDWNEPDGPPDGRSSGTPTVSTSSPTTGQMFPDMATSEVSTARVSVGPNSEGLWPTPTSGDHATRFAQGGMPLGMAARMDWPAMDASPPSISSQAASRASRGAWPGSDGEPRTIVGSGPSSSEPFASYDPATSSWRTSQGSWLAEEAWGLSSEDWPRSGMTRSGTAFRQVPSAPLTGGIASGSSAARGPSAGRISPRGDHPSPLQPPDLRQDQSLESGVTIPLPSGVWPTPGAQDAKHRETPHTILSRKARGKQISLHGAVLLESMEAPFPTPTASMMSATDMEQARFRSDDPRRTVANPQAEFRTPSSRDWKGMSAQSWRDRTTGDPTPTLPDQVGGQLNPTWVEWLMGFPAGWTDCEHLGTPSFRKSLKRSAGG